ncbi:hypothetical protein GCM10020001_015810 [Nonomuraea salmonea]
MREVWPGEPYPLGGTWDGVGTSFAVFSEVAERVELCLFHDDGSEERVDLPEVDGFVWHGYLPGIQPGQRYGYRVHGPYDPPRGHRCNPAKLLLDPYAKAIDGELTWNQALFPYYFTDPSRRNTEDSAPYMPKNVVINPFFEWGNDRPPRIPYHETVIYEAHVRGLTMRHPDVPPDLRGTYAGVGHPAIIEHLLSLGVTAVELMPVHHYVPEHFLVARGLTNYWGYNTMAYLAPHGGYSSAGTRGQQVLEFKAMVRALHEAGIEVILDVVYNHTAEGDHMGPTLGFRGIDNAAYYRLHDGDRRYYLDYTGCGNSLNVRSPHALQLIMDSLRYWVLEMHVDGFRFDLASALARELHDVDRLSAFFDLIQQDPVISQVKLIAEPWDVGPGGYQVGNFPPLWTEWNGKYRDIVRDFWRGTHSALPEFASRLTGSADLYESSGRRPVASINFVTCHDGFTLADLVSYDHKHNEANGEDNRDGTNDNRSWNCGAEGPVEDPPHRDPAPPPAPQLPRHPVPVPGRADAVPRRRDRAHPAGQQQRLLPGQRAGLDRLVHRPHRVRPAGVRARTVEAAPRAPRLPAAPLLPRPPPRRRPARPRVADAGRARDDGRRLAHQLRQVAHGLSERRRHHRARPQGRAHRGRLVPAAHQRPPREHVVHAARRGVRQRLAAGARHQPRHDRGRVRRRALVGRRSRRGHRPLAAGAAPAPPGRQNALSRVTPEPRQP